MKRHLVLIPDGWPVTFADLRPGLFVYDDNVGLKSEYGADAYCETGEMWWGPQPQTTESRSATLVQPVRVEWIEVDDG